MTKKIFLCGASDCFLDPDFPGLSWMEKLQNLLPEYTVETLALEGASNFHIRLQIDRALSQGADYLIVNFTSSARQDFKIREDDAERDLIDRFYRYHLSNNDHALACFNPASMDRVPFISWWQKKVIGAFYRECFDLDLAIQLNYYLIQGALDQLIQQKVPFKFSQGGFEHPSFISSPSKYNFNNYQRYQSNYNLWDCDIDYTKRRPYFHITDPAVTDQIADYYAKEICNHFKDAV